MGACSLSQSSHTYLEEQLNKKYHWEAHIINPPPPQVWIYGWSILIFEDFAITLVKSIKCFSRSLYLITMVERNPAFSPRNFKVRGGVISRPTWNLCPRNSDDTSADLLRVNLRKSTRLHPLLRVWGSGVPNFHPVSLIQRQFFPIKKMKVPIDSILCATRYSGVNLHDDQTLLFNNSL